MDCAGADILTIYKRTGCEVAPVKKSMRPYYFLVAFAIVLYAVLMNGSLVAKVFTGLWTIVYPVAVGFILAFILNVPMAGFERLLSKLSGKTKKPAKPQLIAVISLILTILAVLLVVALVIVLVIPSLVDSVTSLYNLIINKWPEWAAYFSQYDIDTSRVTQWLESLDMKNLLSHVTSGAGSIISTTVGAVSTVVSSLVSFSLSFVIACYVLLSKKTLARQATKLVKAFCKPRLADRILHTADLTCRTFARFLSGQCLESSILGMLIFVALAIFGIPYSGLIGVLTAVCAFIPYIGAFISCAIGAFLVLLTAPNQVIWCIVIYLVVQFVENQFIYPHVVGSSVGLSPLWTLVAVLIGGNFMGILGMIFFIPVVAVFMELLSEFTNNALRKKQAQSSEPDAPAPENPQ